MLSCSTKHVKSSTWFWTVICRARSMFAFTSSSKHYLGESVTSFQVHVCFHIGTDKCVSPLRKANKRSKSPVLVHLVTTPPTAAQHLQNSCNSCLSCVSVFLQALQTDTNKKRNPYVRPALDGLPLQTCTSTSNCCAQGTACARAQKAKPPSCPPRFSG